MIYVLIYLLFGCILFIYWEKEDDRFTTTESWKFWNSHRLVRIISRVFWIVLIPPIYLFMQILTFILKLVS